MNIDKERVQKVLAIMKSEAQLAQDSGAKGKYTFSNFCRENGIFNDQTEFRADDILISCPFHSDTTPSCHLNEGMWAYNCFGCKGGNYINFVHRYRTEVLGEEIGWYQMLDQMLHQDAVLVAKLGFNSIYTKETVSISEMSKFTRVRFKPMSRKPGTYIELVDRFLQTNPSVEKKKFFILMMQKGIPAKDAWHELFGIKEKKKYSLNEMDTFMEE